MAVCLEHVFAHPTMPAMPHDHSGASLGKPKIRDLEILVFFGIRAFEESEVPCHSHALPRQHHGGKRGARRGRTTVCLKHVSECPTMPALPHDRSGASLGKSKISDFEIFVVRFGLYLPFLAGGSLRFSQNLPENIDF